MKNKLIYFVSILFVGLIIISCDSKNSKSSDDFDRVECVNCDGSGVDEECSDCEGVGRTACGYCEGLVAAGEEDCSECGGTGDEECYTCEGNGKADCTVCDGEGDVEVEDDEDIEDDEVAEEQELVDAISYDEYTFDKDYTIEEREAGFFDKRDRDNDEMYKVFFADDNSGSIVYREGFWYNYSIREKTEKLYATKDDAIQGAYDWSRTLMDAGAAIATMIIKKSGPLKKDGTPDMRYKENK